MKSGLTPTSGISRMLLFYLTIVYQIQHGRYDTQLDATFSINSLELKIMPVNYWYIIAQLMPPNIFFL